MAKKSNVYTRGGDQGETSLVSGDRVSKSDERLELYGEVDELNSHLGVVISFLSKSSKLKAHVDYLLEIQKRLFDMGSNLACPHEKWETYKLPQVSEEDIKKMEGEIDRIDEALPPLKNFILPGGVVESSFLHVCRTVSRRLERRMVAYERENPGELGVHNLKYTNRLSDYFFVLSRYVNFKTGENEVVWSGKK